LGLVDRPVLLIRDVVGLFDVCLVRVFPRALSTCPVVRCAPGTRGLRHSSSRNSLGQAVFTLLGLTPYHGAPITVRSGVSLSTSARPTFSSGFGPRINLLSPTSSSSATVLPARSASPPPYSPAETSWMPGDPAR